MVIRSVKPIYFSPTRTTARIVEGIAQGTRLVTSGALDLTPPDACTRPIAALGSELVILGAPVYGGRIPAESAQRFRRFKANGALAVVIVVGERMLVTPTGLVYELYAPHQGGTAVRMGIETEQVTFQKGDKQEALPQVAGSASLTDKRLFLTLTNSHATDAVEAPVSLLGGATATGCRASVLTGEIHSHNTFDQPEAIQPLPIAAAVAGSRFTVTLPATSVTALDISLS